MRWTSITAIAAFVVLASALQASAQTSNDEEKAWQKGHNESPEGEDAEEAWLHEKERGETTVSPTPMEDAGSEAAPGAAPESGAPTSERGLGTPDAERERRHRSRGRVGESIAERQEDRQIQFHFHGYYRARYNWIGNAPIDDVNSPEPLRSKNASYGYMRLRLDPEVTYGPDPKKPIARLRFTIDGLDNVVFGDNARVIGVPLFAVDQSKTDVNGFDLTESLKLERAWIEFLVPVGQISVGRMESHWATGIQSHDGNGLAEWGDFMIGETYDRIIFATMPMTIGRAIKKDDTSDTPLLYAFVYDRLSQDPVLDSTIPSPPVATDPNFKPFYTTFDARSTAPLAYLTNLDRRTNEIVNVLAWWDPDYGNAPNDELFAGLYVVYRWQNSTESRVIIPDVGWGLRHTLKKKPHLAITTEGEYFTIQGHSGALAFTGGCPPAPCNRGTGNIHNTLARIGVLNEGDWKVQLEGGFASGDADILSFSTEERDSPVLSTRGFHENVKVGLLMYQVALKALSFERLGGAGAQDLGATGSVFNSKYFLPSFRITLVDGLELHTQFLIAWAHKLDPIIYTNEVEDCGFKSDCFYGWEADLAFRARMGKNDIVWIDLEAGMMQPGPAFTNAGMNEAWLWTAQLRAAMIF
jgi:hypothetical protein